MLISYPFRLIYGYQAPFWYTCLTDSLCLTDWLTDWATVCLIDCTCDSVLIYRYQAPFWYTRPTDSLCLTDWLSDCMSNWLYMWLCLIYRYKAPFWYTYLTDSLWLTDWDCMSNWLYLWLIDRMIDCMMIMSKCLIIYWPIVCLIEYVWLVDWLTTCMPEWLTERLYV